MKTVQSRGNQRRHFRKRQWVFQNIYLQDRLMLFDGHVSDRRRGGRLAFAIAHMLVGLVVIRAVRSRLRMPDVEVAFDGTNLRPLVRVQPARVRVGAQIPVQLGRNGGGVVPFTNCEGRKWIAPGLYGAARFCEGSYGCFL